MSFHPAEGEDPEEDEDLAEDPAEGEDSCQMEEESRKRIEHLLYSEASIIWDIAKL